MNKTIQQEVLNGLYCLNAMVTSQTAAMVAVVCEDDVVGEPMEVPKFSFLNQKNKGSYGKRY